MAAGERGVGIGSAGTHRYAAVGVEARARVAAVDAAGANHAAAAGALRERGRVQTTCVIESRKRESRL